MKTFIKILTYLILTLSCFVLFYGAKFGKIGHEKGNEYTVNRIANIGNEVYYQIYIDATKHGLFNSKYFLTLEEYRNRRLKEINI